MTSVVRRQSHDDSGEYSDASQDVDHSNSGNDGGQQESDYDSHGSDSEQSDRDPDSQETERRVDDDEDRSNPQYIPKRGTFYEHDDRTAASAEESSNTTSETTSEKKESSDVATERRRPPRKSDVINKWSHDKYNENEQMPKSREELVAIYGYDIRNEDAPPHARRNRRYGRGPNKYTRTWEDEEAYRRQNTAPAPPRKPPNPEDFPELDAAGKKFSKKTRNVPRPRSKSQPASNESLENGTQLRRNASIKTPKPKPPAKTAPSRNVPVKPPVKTQPKEKMPPLENLTITASVNNSQGQPQRKVNATVAQQRPVPTQHVTRKPQVQPQQQQPAHVPPNKSPPQQQQQQQQQPQKPQPQNQQSQPQQQPTTGAESRGGSKRYSSLRQRPLAEPYSPQQQQQPPPPQQPQQQQQQPQQQPQQTQQPHRYHADFASGGQQNAPHQGSPVPQIHPQQLAMHQAHRPTPAAAAPPHGPSPPHQPPQQHAQQVRLGMLEQQQMVSHPHHAIHNIPQPHSIGQIPAAQGYAPPAMMPAQYMQVKQNNSGAVFGGAPIYAQPPAPYPHQMYPHHNYATQAGGVTYYNCAEQEPLPRAQRRPTAAIPIVRPAAPDRPANSTERDNIDRIVENMFVRKPWPTHGSDSKDKQDNRNSQEPTSKDASQSNSLTSSSISTDSKPSDGREEREEVKEDRKEEKETEVAPQESIVTDA